MAGRNPKPQEIKDLQGTARNDRKNEDRMNPMRMVSVPEPPEFLDEGGVELWNRQLKQLIALDMLTVVDLTALSRYCQAWDRWLQAVENIKEHGNRNEHDQVSPDVSERKNAHKEMLQLEDRFGFLPTAREKISTPKRSDSEDPLEAHMNKKTG